MSAWLYILASKPGGTLIVAPNTKWPDLYPESAFDLF
jgi:hypothetical protein